MDLIVAYQNELLALVAILVVIFIYLIIKRKTTSSSTQKRTEEIVTVETTKPVVEEVVAQQEEEVEAHEKAVETEDTSATLLDGKEEGDFGVVEEKDAEKVQVKQKVIKKREVPPHAKITKDDFKEFSGQRILLAEDNIINQKVILGLLAESGIDVVVANDGVEALEILEKDDNFILILMDAHMPRMDGFEATRKIRKNPALNHIVVVALSGDTAADDIRKMTEAGMSEHLEKPLKMDALYDVIYAYTPDENASSSLNYTELDIEEGMEISGNDTAFYHEILNEFINSYNNAHEVIESLIKQNNTENADRLLLDIIGVSANIGAQKLTATAREFKTSLNSDDNEKSRLLFKFKEDLENLVKEIKSYLLTNN
ncbi:response regulator [Sulfurimonas sp. NWX79]|uniref:response regulator n=1 Tax=Sulfurimonas sp. NWX79 TaxID=2925412 RepID=UPI003204E325